MMASRDIGCGQAAEDLLRPNGAYGSRAKHIGHDFDSRGNGFAGVIADQDIIALFAETAFDGVPERLDRHPPPRFGDWG